VSLVDGAWCEEEEVEPRQSLEEPDDDWDDEDDEPVETEADRDRRLIGLEPWENSLDDSRDGDLVATPDGYAVVPRSAELGAVGTDPHRKATAKLTPQQRRLREHYGDVVPVDGPQAERERAEIEERIELGKDGASIGPGTRSAVKDEAPWPLAHETHESFKARLENDAWLRENDPRRKLEGVREEIEAVLDECGHALDDVRECAFLPGKPDAERRALRRSVKAALVPMYEQGASRACMANVLRVSRQKLHALMTSSS
jgi:hypothetical protein